MTGSPAVGAGPSGLLAALTRDCDVPPPPQSGISKGSWWLLHYSGGAISAYERHEPAA